MQWLVVANKALRAKLFVLFLLASVSLPAFSEQAQRYQIDIASQNVEQALRALANVTAKQLLFPYDLVESLESTAVSGRYTLISALDIILTGTPLSGELTEDGVILITLSLKKSEGEESDMKSIMNRKKNILASTIAFFVGAGGVNASFRRNQLGMILVFCWKRLLLLRQSEQVVFRIPRWPSLH